MKEIIEIVIESESGYGQSSLAYKDKLIIKKGSFIYRYGPLYKETKVRKFSWSIENEDDTFVLAFDKFCKSAVSIHADINEDMVDDAGVFRLTIKYDDGSKDVLYTYQVSKSIEGLKRIANECIPTYIIFPKCLLY